MPGCGSGAENGTGADVPGTDGGGRGGLAVEEVVDGKVQVLGEVRQAWTCLGVAIHEVLENPHLDAVVHVDHEKRTQDAL